MESELSKYINEFYSGETKDDIPHEPRNFNFHFKGKVGDDESSKHLQNQVEDIVNEEIGKNNDWINIDIRKLDQNQNRLYGQHREKQLNRGYTDKVERTQTANQLYLNRLNILQPPTSRYPLRGQVDDAGAPKPIYNIDSLGLEHISNRNQMNKVKKNKNIFNKLEDGLKIFKNANEKLTARQKREVLNLASGVVDQLRGGNLNIQQISNALQNLAPTITDSIPGFLQMITRVI
jgi:hypothetical protein